MENILNISVFAKLLNKPTSTIYSWRRNGNLPEYIFLKIGGCIFVRKDKFEKFINGEIA